MPGESGNEEVAASARASPPDVKNEELRLFDLHLASLNENKVGEAHIWRNPDASYLAHDLFGPQLPLIDFAPVLQCDPVGRSRVVEQVRSAMEEWGCFQVVNHGRPQQVLDDIVAGAHEFFPRPIEEKQQAAVVLNYMELYLTITKKYDGNSLRWQEALQITYEDDGRGEAIIADNVYPNDPPKRDAFRSSLKEFHREYKLLGDTVLELLGEGLGLAEHDTFSRLTTGAAFRANWYPVCPQPELTFGSGPHTDPNVLTILHQDRVGGLQVQDRSGKWLGVEPVAGALLVNAGDILVPLTNCRVRALPHRAVVNSRQPRVSVGLFLGGSAGTEIAAPKELVDDQHPVQFRPFTVGEYYHVLTQLGYSSSVSDHFRVLKTPAPAKDVEQASHVRKSPGEANGS